MNNSAAQLPQRIDSNGSLQANAPALIGPAGIPDILAAAGAARASNNGFMHRRTARAHGPADETAYRPRRPVSALDGWIDVCRAGTWRDMAGREVAIDEARLDRIVAAHAAADPAPVVVGHPEADAPAFAWIDGLRRSGDRLQARLRDIAPAFREAVETGRYAGRSIALNGDTLRHLGFLGGRAPAVPGLAPTQFAAEPDSVVQFADAAMLAGPLERAAFDAIARTLRSLRERIIARDGQDAADATVPQWEIETVAAAAALPPARADEPPAFSSSRATDTDARDDNPDDNGQEGAMPKTEAELAAESDALDQRKSALDERETTLATQAADLAAREAKQAAAARLAAAEAALKPHVEAGRVLPAEKAGLAALLASLPDGDDAALSFAAADGNGEVSEAPRAIFDRFLAALPGRVDYRTRAGGAAPAPADDAAAIAAEARALRASEAEKGNALSAVDAVDIVTAKRGLPTGGAT